MKKILITLSFVSLLIGVVSGQTVQFTLKAISATQVQFLFRPTANIVLTAGSRIASADLVLQIPNTFPDPTFLWTVVAGPYTPGFDIAANAQQNTLANPKGWNQDFTFAGPSTSLNPSINLPNPLVAGTEYLIATITVPPGVPLTSLTGIDWGNNALDNATGMVPINYSTSIEINQPGIGAADATNNAAVWYQSSATVLPNTPSAGTTSTFSTSVNNSGNMAAQSTIGFSVILPLTLLDFTAVAKNNNALLNWSTADEVNSKGFVIERSADGRVYTSIGTVNALGTGSNKYTLTDVNVIKGVNYYRLRIQDKDGSEKISPVRVVNFGKVNVNLISASPNPAKSNTAIQINTPLSETVSFRVLDALGKTVNRGTFQGKTEIRNLPVGTYILDFTSESLKQQIKIIVQ